jgi:hypothetical protein
VRGLGLVEHPDVVVALDAGTTEDGTPYLVLELLEGAAGCARDKLRAGRRRGRAALSRPS